MLSNVAFADLCEGEGWAHLLDEAHSLGSGPSACKRYADPNSQAKRGRTSLAVENGYRYCMREW